MVVLGALAVAAVGAVIAAVGLLSGPAPRHLSADLASTTSLYPGAPVKILGVTVGTVEDIRVRGDRVRVEMTYDAAHPLPADVHAAVVPPSLVGDRFVQLVPPYTGGPQLPDGAHLDLERTQVPVELDRTLSGLEDLATALGPDGANRRGSLSRMVTGLAGALDGNGAALDDTVRQLSGAVGTLDRGGEDLNGTVRNLADVTGALAGHDDQVRALLANLAQVSGELDGQRDELGAAAKNLDLALRDITGFLDRNRDAVTGNIARLRDVAGTVSAHRRSLAGLLEVAPLTVSNLAEVIVPMNFDPAHPEAVNPAGRTTVLAGRFDGIPQSLPDSLALALDTVCAGLPPDRARELAPACAAVRNGGGTLGELLLRVTNARPGGRPLDLAGLLTGGRR
jgi:phospholipid/cholesterol/gamma-HCH transport system substrate-binding protein